ncbi:MAG: hypothetical protein OEU54_16425, partial [Gemmatimonadota bacterium]|nr:hypothetical protein [Gemmatimonadota bacterium]
MDSTARYGERKFDRTRPAISATALMGLAAVLTGCASGGAPATPEPTEPTFDYRAEYRVSCNVSDECRVQYIDEGGVLRARDIVGEWDLAVGVNAGTRMWLRAWGGGAR